MAGATDDREQLMAWSTRQVAELAGTTVKAVRHYHQVGLLAEPERASNGYKQYRTPHLVRLLQIKRLSDLGLPLSQIATLGNADSEPDQAIRVLDAELAATMERLARIRAELAILLHHRAPMELPVEFGPVAEELSEADRALILIYSRVMDAEAMEQVRNMVGVRDVTDEEFDALGPEADEATIERLAARMVPAVRKTRGKSSWTSDPSQHAAQNAQKTVMQAVLELYNPAQVRVLRRANVMANQDSATHDAQDQPPPETSRDS